MMMTATTSHGHDGSIRATSHVPCKSIHFQSRRTTDASTHTWVQRHAIIGDVQCSSCEFSTVDTNATQDRPMSQNVHETACGKENTRYTTLNRYLDTIATINAELILLLLMNRPKCIRADQSTVLSTHTYERMLSSWVAPRKSDWSCWLKSIASSRCDKLIGLFSSSVIARATDTAFLI